MGQNPRNSSHHFDMMVMSRLLSSTEVQPKLEMSHNCCPGIFEWFIHQSFLFALTGDESERTS